MDIKAKVAISVVVGGVLIYVLLRGTSDSNYKYTANDGSIINPGVRRVGQNAAFGVVDAQVVNLWNRPADVFRNAGRTYDSIGSATLAIASTTDTYRDTNGNVTSSDVNIGTIGGAGSSFGGRARR